MGWHLLISAALGILSGTLTYLASQDSPLALLVGAVVFALYWLGCIAVIVIDD